MLETKQLKAQGLRFGRSFQMALRTSVIFSAEHPSLTRPLEQSFEQLNELLKETGQFTIGFVDNQVLINSVLTTDTHLAPLEKEFLKRGIAALTFEAGLTLARYKRIVTVLSAPATAIQEAGGIREFLEMNEIPGARIVVASRNQKKNEEGDTVIESDSEAFIISKQMAEDGNRDLMDSLDALLDAACVDQNARAAALANAGVMNPNHVGEGYGVPIAVPNLVVDKATKPGEGWDEHTDGERRGAGPLNGRGNGIGGNGNGNGGNGHGSGNGLGAGYSGSEDDSFVGLAPGAGGAGGGGSYYITSPASQPKSNNGGYSTFMELVQDSVNRSLMEENGNPRKSYLALARILRESRLDTVLAHFPEDKREELRTLPPEELAAEYIEHNTLELIAKQLKQIPQGQDKFVVEEDVLRLLARSLQATHMADRLAFKLAKFFQEFSTPPHLQAKIQDELRWTALTPRQKFTRLMEKGRYDFSDFRRMMEVIKDLHSQREPEKVVQLALHYFDFLDEYGVKVEAEELSRSVELIRAAKLGREPDTVTIIQRLGSVLLRKDVSELIHYQAANNLAVLSQSASLYESFDKVVLIAEVLRQGMGADQEKHKKCCLTALSRMLAPTSIDRLIEVYIANRADGNFAKVAASILRHSHPAGTEATLNHLIEEKNANIRMALLRLITQIGPITLEVIRKYLRNDQWYVVRNMCNLLAELRDPELAYHISDALRHPDPRVQQAALNALTRTRAHGRAALIATSLLEMAPIVLEPALDELQFLRAVESIPGLEDFAQSARTPAMLARRALQTLNSIPGETAITSLRGLAETAPEMIRKAAAELVAKRGVESVRDLGSNSNESRGIA